MKWVLKKFEDLSTYELYEIIQLRLEVFVVEQDCVYQDCDGKKDYESHHLLGIESNKIEAYLRVVPPGISYKEVAIGRVITSQNVRGKGIGYELMKEGIVAVENIYGKVPIRISAQEHLKNYYGSVGFEQVSESYLEDGIPHIEMLRHMTNS